MTACALGRAAVHDHKAQGLLVRIAGWADVRSRDEGEVGVAMLAEALVHIKAFGVMILDVINHHLSIFRRGR